MNLYTFYCTRMQQNAQFSMFLQNLKWLDLKDNNLVEPLNSVAGDCLDDAQCKKCAKNVSAQRHSQNIHYEI